MRRIAVVLAVLLAMMITAPIAAQAAPTPPTIVTSITFNNDCTNALIGVQWDRWRADRLVFAVEDSTNTQVAPPSVVLIKAARKGGTTGNVFAPAGAPYNGSWAGFSVKGFAAAELTSKGASINDRTDLVTCVPVT